jgi:hypothetical protein
MPPTKRALLIASPFDNLKGPVQDVGTMTNILRRYGFEDITRCSAAEATRTRILQEWKEMVDRTMSGDIVVFYFSGHGALVKPTSGESGVSTQLGSLQFIVPMDYHKSNTKDFRGILDVEISYFIRQITKKTENVTVILDC